MREVTHFVVVFPTRLMSASYEEKKAVMDALRREYPHYEFDALEAFDTGIADDDHFGVVPVTGRIGESDDPDEVYLCKPLDPTVIPDIMQALQRCETLKASLN